jgi:hypothetical protein
MLHTDMSDGPGVIDLTGAGLRNDRLIPKVRALLLQQAAHGHSLSGDAGAYVIRSQSRSSQGRHGCAANSPYFPNSPAMIAKERTSDVKKGSIYDAYSSGS